MTPTPAPQGPAGAAADGSPRATATERHALTEMMRLMRQAHGDHPALADARAEIAARIDTLLSHLQAAGIDTDALQDQIDAELDAEPADTPGPPA